MTSSEGSQQEPMNYRMQLNKPILPKKVEFISNEIPYVNSKSKPYAKDNILEQKDLFNIKPRNSASKSSSNISTSRPLYGKSNIDKQ